MGPKAGESWTESARPPTLGPPFTALRLDFSAPAFAFFGNYIRAELHELFKQKT